ncbi:cell division protein FtsQ/DivIB [Ruania halotolerans]|uniref:cell division protein FtsQ/DivIB n=1 Tax=Ruania halotolerans TaxID=2897773 RepID=UPI001E3A4A10|nr:FtsQ-type POTRA domain-containing protein [Ruania halotolerans]UFU05119.1 FtsQ-type POTRA domain-containing protein [Ruania halotolerans]
MRAPAQPRRRTPRSTTPSAPAAAAGRELPARTGAPARARSSTVTRARATEKEQARLNRSEEREQRRAQRRSRHAEAADGALQGATQRASGANRGAQLSERIAERRSAVRRLRWRGIAAALAAVLVVAGLSWLVLASPVLVVHAEDVVVTGTSEYIEEEQIQEIAAVAHEVPVARVDTGGVAEEIRELSAVRDVQIRRSWPNGLEIALEPRVPVATVSDGDRYALLDAEAVVMVRRDEPVDGVPQVTVPLDDPDTAESLTAVLTVLAALPEDIQAEVSSAGAETPYQVRLELTDGDEVVWGSAEENTLKVEVFRTLRQVEASTYDLSAPRSPITTE